MKNIYIFSASSLFILMVLSLFLPQYETLTDGMCDDYFSYISQYPNPDQSGGLFGGGYYTTFNGFGSVNAIAVIVLSFATTLLTLHPHLTKKMLIIPLIVLVLLFVLVILEIIFAPYLLSEPDKLFSGFYSLRIAEIGIFYLAFLKARKNTKPSLSNSETMDD